MANQTSAIYTDDTAKTIDTSLNAKLKDITGQSILASIGAYFTAAKNAIESRLKSQNIADVEATATASQAYAQGEHLMYNGDLYKAKTAIAQGATLTVGTNIEAVKVGTEISQLNSASTKNNLDTAVDLSSYTSDKYTIPADGYVVVGTNSSSTASIQVYSESYNNLYFSLYSCQGMTIPCFVRKGMKVRAAEMSGNSYYARYYALK